MEISKLIKHRVALSRKSGTFFLTFLGLAVLSVMPVQGVDLIPQPKSVVWSPEVFRLGSDLAIVAGAETLVAARDLQRELKEGCGISCAIFPPAERPKGALNRGVAGKRAVVLQVEGLDAKDPVSPEGYTLEVGEQGILIRSKGAAGVFYGVQTLKQLFQRKGDDLVALGCTIRDEPALAWRGVYLNLRPGVSGPETVASLKRLVDGFAQLKLNVLFFEIADAMRYERQAFPATAKRAFSKAQVKELVTYAQARHFEVIPAFQMLSHVPWILANPQNVKLLENPAEQGWHTAWCPSNPAVDLFIKDILAETLELFQPRYCQIGLDEVNYGPFGECEKCRQEKPSQLFLKSILSAHDVLAARGVKTIMWHDTLLPGTEFKNKARGHEIVDRLPRDIIIAYWDYGVFDAAAKKRLESFTQKGFSVLGATFCDPKGIQTLAMGLARNPRALGMLSTHWYNAGDWSKPRMMSPLAWFAQVLEAQYAWNPTTPSLSEIRYDPVQVMRRMLGPKASLANRGEWSPVALDGVLNGRIGNGAGSWPGYGAGNSLDPVFAKNIVCDDVTFRMAGGTTSNNVLLLGDAKDNLTGVPVTIPIKRKAARIAFLHSCNVPWNADELAAWNSALAMPLVGTYKINYDDGTACDVPLLYRWNIMDWNNKTGAFEGRVAYAGKTQTGARIELIRTDWVNPSPGKIIASITVSATASQGMSLALFAMSTEGVRQP